MAWHTTTAAFDLSTYLQGLAAESSPTCFSDTDQFVPLKSKTIRDKSCCSDNETASCQSSPFGMTCEPSTDDHGEGLSRSSRAAFHARIYQAPAEAPAWPVNDPVYGLRWPALSVKYDRDSFSWKIHPGLFNEDLMSCSVTLPPWGSMHGGELSEQTMPAHLNGAKECGLLPTPVCQPSKRKLNENGESVSAKGTRWGKSLYQVANGWPCPKFQEWMMGWPTGWTDRKPLATGNVPNPRPWHGEYLQGQPMNEALTTTIGGSFPAPSPDAEEQPPKEAQNCFPEVGKQGKQSGHE